MNNHFTGYYIECLRELLKSLDVQDVELFLERLTLKNCRKLGLDYILRNNVNEKKLMNCKDCPLGRNTD